MFERFMIALSLAGVLIGADSLAEDFVPRRQSAKPGPPLSPQDAMAKMKLPAGFKVELAASEPNVINPTAMTFDERGRIWICESVEYPRASAGAGQDRVKILEDVDGDGFFEKVTVFKDGLNIPCGVAIGNGGVYVTNAPDILFLQDTNDDGVADKEEVILTGFGRADRHELPNSLIWGPDGWLYGMNGVFNPSKITHGGATHNFTCAIFRYHPKQKKFELFAEGTSNPWGLDYDTNGEWFLSCCVIDHLFHMTQSGYYHRQGGPYPPFTRKLPSITTQHHQQAAYAGLCIYNGNAYPEEYSGTLFMGNLHGSCINRDIVTKNGATFTQKNAPDFLSAHDVWFMPVAQKVGPDGCIYIMDWYDRYHCYQDANRDAPGLDRKHGRIYRISYNGTPLLKNFNLAALKNDELIKTLSHANAWQRREAQRLLNERFEPGLIPVLRKMALADDKSQAHMHALWLLCSQNEMDAEFHATLLSHSDPVKRNWGVRAAGQLRKVSQPIYEKLKSLAADPSPEVRVQVAIAAGRLSEPDGLPVLFAMLSNLENAKDPLIPTIIYNNLLPLVKSRGSDILAFIDSHDAVQAGFANSVVPWITEVLNASGANTPEQIMASLKRAVGANAGEAKMSQALRKVIDGFTAANVKAADRAKLFDENLRATVSKLASGSGEAKQSATVVAMWWKDAQAVDSARTLAQSPKAPVNIRGELLRALAENRDAGAFDVFSAIVADKTAPAALRKDAIEALSAQNDAKSAAVLVANFTTLPDELKAQCVNALVQSPASAGALVEALEQKHIPKTSVNSNHVRQVLALNDDALSKRLVGAWGTVRTDRDPERVEVIKQVQGKLAKMKGNAVAGWKVFEAKCQQCHKIYGKGNDVGPELTGAGRENVDAILANILDPNLVIGEGYYQYVAKTKGGRVVTGLLAEQSDARVVLKREGSVLETISRDDIEKLTPQKISLMPEGLEKNMTEQEFADLVEFLLTKSPPKAGAAAPAAPKGNLKIGDFVNQFAPGWSAANCGQDMSPGFYNEIAGRKNVLVTHPLDRNTPCVLKKPVDVPEGKKTVLKLSAGHHDQGDWLLVVKADGQELLSKVIGKEAAINGWTDITVDLSPFAGKSVNLELLNQANGWAFEAAFWGGIEFKSE